MMGTGRVRAAGFVGVGVTVSVGVAVLVGVRVGVGLGVGVFVFVCVGVAVAVSVGVCVGLGIKREIANGKLSVPPVDCQCVKRRVEVSNPNPIAVRMLNSLLRRIHACI